MTKKAIILTADQFEDLEVLVPKNRLEEAGWSVDVAAPERGWLEGEHGYEVEAHWDLDEVKSEDYDLLLIPGGPPEGGAGTVRSYRSARRVVREFMEAGKPVAAICHGPWVLVSSDVVEGRRLTSVHKDGVPDEIEDAGGEWLDEEVVVDGNLVTSRTPKDLPAFLREVMQMVEKGPAKRSRSSKKSGKRPSRGPNSMDADGPSGDASNVVEVTSGMS